MEYVNKQPRIGIHRTSNNDGKVAVAVFGSHRMVDEKTVIVGWETIAPLAYLQENPHGVFIIVDPAERITDWKDIRVYENESVPIVRSNI